MSHSNEFQHNPRTLILNYAVEWILLCSFVVPPLPHLGDKPTGEPQICCGNDIIRQLYFTKSTNNLTFPTILHVENYFEGGLVL